ncbi:MAG TPA: hypothetical protein VLD67_09645 [Vicinamibacterales bacterium]|nr:hypothetical protein [Vicinamibacterales bacterium]
MRRVARLTIFCVLLPATALRAEAVTVSDIIDLTRAGLSDEVLLALIEVDGRVFTVDTATLTRLKEAGVSDRVIVAMVRSGRSRPPDPPLLTEQIPAEPQVIVIEHERPVIHEVPVAVPVYVPVAVRSGTKSRTRHVQEVPGQFPWFGISMQRPAAPPPAKRAEPVYWGWGGKLRPDAWKPDK